MAARAAGVGVHVDGDDLVLEAAAQPPPDVLDLLSQHKAGIVALLHSPTPSLPRTPKRISPLPCLAEPNALDREGGIAAQPDFVAGLLIAPRRRPPTWADPAALPSPGCLCTCCKGQRWWCEREAPKGWRCWICHPPDHLPADAVLEVRT
jgi:hypothetical protein